MPRLNDPGQDQPPDPVSALRASRPPVTLESSEEEEEDSENEQDNHVGDDDEDGENAPGGYEPLPQEDEDHEADERNVTDSPPPSPEEGEDEDITVVDRAQWNPDELRAMVEETERARRREELREIATVWSSSSSSSTQEKRDAMALDSVKVDAIRTAMSSFTLPPSAIPGWAADMGEDEWRDLVQKKLLQSTKK